MDDTTIFISGTNINDTLYFRILTVSDDLEIVSDITVPLVASIPLEQYPVLRGTLDPENNIVTSVECSLNTSKNKSVMMVKLNLDGEVIAGPVESSETCTCGGDNSLGMFSINPIQYAYFSLGNDGNRYIIVTCHDKNDLSVKWERRITGYPSHPGDVPYSTITLENGMTAIHNWSYNDRIMVLFVEDFTSVDESGIEAIPYLCHPNPASNTLHMDISSDVADHVNEISLYDISGRLVKTQSSGFGSIDISGLATGMYVMKVTLDDGKVFEEKIVKE